MDRTKGRVEGSVALLLVWEGSGMDGYVSGSIVVEEGLVGVESV